MRIYFNKSITVYRLSQTGDEKYALHGTIDGAIMSISPEDMMISEGNPAQMSVLFTYYNSDIQKGDKITYDGDDYIIKGVRPLGPVRTTLQYRKAVISKMNS